MRAIRTTLTALMTCGLFAAGCSADVGETEQDQRASESVHTFECSTDAPMPDGERHTLRFQVVGLDAPDFDEDFVWPDEEEDPDCEGCPVTVQPTESELSALNENAVVLRENGKLVLEGDADGFYWVTMALYENSGYTSGYVRLEDGGGFIDEHYGTVSCTVTKETPAARPDVSDVVGFYVNDEFEWSNAPLMAAIYPASDDLPAGFAGYVDLSVFDESTEETTVTSGFYKIAGEEGGYELEAVTSEGEPLATLRIEDRVLSVDDVRLSKRFQLSGDEYIKQCYALSVVEYELEESFTPWEYPGVDVSVDEAGNYSVSFGVSGYDAEDAEIVVETSEAGDFEAMVRTDYSTYVLRIPAGTPSRGQVLFGDDLESLSVMAHLGCYE